MPRTADPRRRREVVDAVITQLTHTGIANVSLRALAEGLGQSTRVLTHHFPDKSALLWAVLERLDELQHTALRSTPGWDDPSTPVSHIVRAAWERNMRPDEIAMTRLIREIEGLAAGGRLPAAVPGFVRGRAEFVASCLVVRGVPNEAAMVQASLLNAAFSGLEGDYLITGDQERAEAALDNLCAWIDTYVGHSHSSRPR
ncbi:AcrR family transcriptional regulator [Lipingzhangella halophila]|uniref:AcrR family transcriptional regulator n=1 Tax=Lipingzhangella halophila TaxID=1783352 RepID=A0A7W7W5K8_9ACTN|nr:TetR/AcrR family transcriptional regulator [Lipingzhangella halophila]MBB4934891.1 AcrR family transcriptional regulator [Lipingzhangella halophila]